MTKEQVFFLQTLSNYINNIETQSVDELQWNVIYNYAKIHQLISIVYSQCKSLIPLDIKDAFMRSSLTEISYNCKRTVCNKEIRAAFSNHGIESFVVKGPVIAEYYPTPKFRAMSDTDIIVHSKDRELCHEILLSLGYTNYGRQYDREWHYMKGALSFELHNHLIYNQDINIKSHELFFNSCWDYVHDGILDINFHFLFLISHLRRHFMNSGVGFRQFMDLAVIIKYSQELDWVWIENKLNELRLLQFAKICFYLIQHWFCVETKISCAKKDRYFLDTATQKVFEDGIFGFDNSDNRTNGSINKVIKHNSRFIGYVSSVVSMLMPSYKEMITVPQYTFLKGKPYLLPIAWIYRFAMNIKQHKIKYIIHRLVKIHVSNEDIKKRKKIFQQWGLNEHDVEM